MKYLVFITSTLLILVGCTSTPVSPISVNKVPTVQILPSATVIMPTKTLLPSATLTCYGKCDQVK